MFNKPFRVKSNSQLKGSERKKIRTDILKSFPELTEEDLTTLIPNKDTISGAKIFTNTGDSIVLYSAQKVPIIFELDNILYPTVYMLWKFPNLIPTLTTWPQVYPKIIGGADLMLPGVVLKGTEPVNITSYGNLKKGACVSINLVDNKAPVAVGQAVLSSEDMYMAARKGKAVKVLHCVGDQLWSYGTKLNLPQLGIPEGYQDMCGFNEDECLPLHNADQPEVKSIANLAKVDTTDHVELPIETTSLEELQASMDNHFEYCFLKALKSSAKKLELPLLTSNFYKLHMIPACPQQFKLDIKKSSYKKLSKFLSMMAENGIIQLKELSKGVESIMSVNFEHEKLRRFVDLYDKGQDVHSDENSGPHGPSITEMYSVTAAVLPVLSAFGFKKGSNLAASDIRKHLTTYVKSNNLQNSENPSLVILDPVLHRLCKLEVNVTEISWQDLMTSFLSVMTRSFQIDYLTGANPIQAKGKLEPIDIQVATRSGNKKVTLVYNLELYGIDINEFARTCQHGVAASTSVTNTVNHRKGSQLLIQGNQVLFVGKLLQEKFDIPKRYIRGLEKAIKPK